ncbi:MAG: helix-turn-helix domain-containing protein, partial [Candidatus Dormibacteraeota bacterium]|nr:helix-turn-helix domain-containing protein [Candidatus Dormibacteraeota bacterium]
MSKAGRSLATVLVATARPFIEEPPMLTLEERLVVVNLYEDLGSYRAVAELTGCDHKTVKAWVERQRE